MAAPRLIGAGLAVSLLAACDSDASGPAGSYVYDAEAGTITASALGDGGDTTMLSGPAIAEPLPIDIPVIPGGEVTKATHVAAADGLRIALVELISEQSPADVAAYYRAAAQEAGLSTALDMPGPAGITFIAIGADRSRMTLHVARARIAPDGTRLPAPPEDTEGTKDTAANGGEDSDGGDGAADYRDVTAAQLYIIGKAPPSVQEIDPAP